MCRYIKDLNKSLFAKSAKSNEIIIINNIPIGLTTEKAK